MCLVCTKRNREIGSLITHLSTSPYLWKLEWDHSGPWMPQVTPNKPLASLCFPNYPVAGESFSAGHDPATHWIWLQGQGLIQWLVMMFSGVIWGWCRTSKNFSLWVKYRLDIAQHLLEDEARILSSQRMMSALSSPSSSPALLSFHPPLPLLPLYHLFVFGLISHLFMFYASILLTPSAHSFSPVTGSSLAFQSSCILLVPHAGCHTSFGPTGH